MPEQANELRKAPNETTTVAPKKWDVTYCQTGTSDELTVRENGPPPLVGTRVDHELREVVRVVPAAGWDATLLSSDGKRMTVIRCDNPPALGPLYPWHDQPHDGFVTVVKVSCSACKRSGFVVPHDPRVCTDAHDESRGYYASERPTPKGPPKALPERKTAAGRATVRRQVAGLL